MDPVPLPGREGDTGGVGPDTDLPNMDLETMDEDDGELEAAIALVLPVTVPEAAARDRLDRVLALTVPPLADALTDPALKAAAAGLSRSRLKALIDEGRVSLGGQTINDPSYRVKGGQVFLLSVPAPEPAVPQAQNLPLSVIYEDDHLLVIDKAAGMVVHPAAGNPDGTLVNALLGYCGDRLSGIGGVRRPGIVHRLDKDTSGLMVVAKTDQAHAGLSAQFADRTLSRTYRAVVRGAPTLAAGSIEGNIGRHPSDRKRMAVVTHGGKPALTHWRVLARYGEAGQPPVAAQVECKLATGRTHQIRVHMAQIGLPLIGDPLYGRTTPVRQKDAPEAVRVAIAGFPRQALHAKDIAFRHPATGEMMHFSTELPADLVQLTATLERF